MAWKIEYSNRSLKQLKKLSKEIQRKIVDFMDYKVGVSPNPRYIGGYLKGVHKTTWRYRIGDYRILCQIHDDIITVEVIAIGHRKEIYRD